MVERLTLAICAACCFVSAAWAADEHLPIAKNLVAYLNGQLQKTGTYRGLQLQLDSCGLESCVYRLNPGKGFAEIATMNNNVEAVRFIAPISSGSDGFSVEVKALTYLFSIIVWNKMPKTAKYEDANKFLSDLINDAVVNTGAAIAPMGDWTFGFVSINCFGSSNMMIGLRTFSGSIKTLTKPPQICKR